MIQITDIAGRILVVDDIPANRELVGDCMERAGHAVRLASSAEEALSIIQSWDPDVIILDIMMPKVDGLKFCQQLKSDPLIMAIPIILMTAMSDRSLRIRGIEAGANDFLLKPVEPIEVTLRVRNALRLKRLYDRMKQSNDDLRRIESLRDSMTHMLIHDLRSPLMAISLNLDSLAEDATRGEFENIISDSRSCRSIVTTLTEMIGTILDVSRLEAKAMPIEPSSCELGLIINDGLSRISEISGSSIEVSIEPLVVIWDRCLMARAITNLVSNAIKFSSGKPVKIQCLDHGLTVEIQIDDAGPGVPIDDRERIFEKYGSIGTGFFKRDATGLGLHFCKHVASAHDGHIGVVSLEPTGSRFWMRLPKTAAHMGTGAASLSTAEEEVSHG
jgi:two-component system sensor histidine kinase/response regulator